MTSPQPTSPYACAGCAMPLPFSVNFCPNCGHPQANNTGQLWMGDRRLVTIIFADLASFTATSEKTDPEDVIDMLNQVFSRLAVEYDREGGYLDKTVGDQLMVLFGAPRAHEDDPVRAVRAALGMQAAMEEMAPLMREKVGHAFKLNIGINTGIVVWGRMGPAGRMAATVIGDDVNLASRLEHYATNGQIIVSDPVFSLTRQYFEYEVLEPIAVKGKTNPIPIYQPLRPRQSFHERKQHAERHKPIIERDREMQLLHAHMSHAITGQARLVLLTGAAGMGKSRLLSEFMGDIENYSFGKRPIVLQSFGGAGSREGYSPLAELCTQLFDIKPEDNALAQRRKIEDRGKILGLADRNFVPLVGYLLGWYQNDDRLAAASQNMEQIRGSALSVAVTMFLKQASRRPLLIAIDNLQWADANSLAWLQMLGSTKAHQQFALNAYELLLVAATRPQLELPLASIHADEIIELAPLSQLAQRDMIFSLLPGADLPASLIDRLVNESGGNPFYLEEAARGLVQSRQLVRQDGKWHMTRPIDQIFIPHSIEGQVMAHLDILGETSRRVLQHAAVIGMNFDYETLARITPVGQFDVALEDLLQRALIKETTPPGPNPTRAFSFSQVVVREVAYKSMLRKTRRELHQQIAELTEAREAAKLDGANVESLARHYVVSGDDEKVVVYNWLVGQRALEQLDFDSAFRHLDIAYKALQETDDKNPETTLKILSGLGDACTFTGHFEQAAACYQQVWGIVQNDPAGLMHLYYRIGRLNLHQGNIQAAATSYQYAQNLAGDNPELLAQIAAETCLMFDLDE
ncbi:MAG: hypothetical protein Kow0031_17500 [Anaerolineae bacterium]